MQLYSDQGEQTKLSGCSGDSGTQKGACRKPFSHTGMGGGGLHSHRCRALMLLFKMVFGPKSFF